MKRKLSPDAAFDHYVGLGVARSYQAVADQFGVSKVAVTNLAAREGWQDRLKEIEQKARKNADEKAVETLEQINDRHRKAARIVMSKALEALRSLSFTNASQAARALEAAMNRELAAVGVTRTSSSAVTDESRESADEQAEAILTALALMENGVPLSPEQGEPWPEEDVDQSDVSVNEADPIPE